MVDRYDAFHELIAIDEVCRSGSAGVAFSLLISLNVGLPPILHFGSKYLQDKVCRDCLTGKKRVSFRHFYLFIIIVVFYISL